MTGEAVASMGTGEGSGAYEVGALVTVVVSPALWGGDNGLAGWGGPTWRLSKVMCLPQ
jgi:hypothetical protein